MSDNLTALPTDAERRAELVKRLRKYRSDGYAVELSADGFTATLSRKRKLGLWLNLILTILTAGLWLIVVAIKLVNRKTETVVLFVDEAGKIVKA